MRSRKATANMSVSSHGTSCGDSSEQTEAEAMAFITNALLLPAASRSSHKRAGPQRRSSSSLVVRDLQSHIVKEGDDHALNSNGVESRRRQLKLSYSYDSSATRDTFTTISMSETMSEISAATSSHISASLSDISAATSSYKSTPVMLLSNNNPRLSSSLSSTRLSQRSQRQPLSVSSKKLLRPPLLPSKGDGQILSLQSLSVSGKTPLSPPPLLPSKSDIHIRSRRHKVRCGDDGQDSGVSPCSTSGPNETVSSRGQDDNDNGTGTSLCVPLSIQTRVRGKRFRKQPAHDNIPTSEATQNDVNNRRPALQRLPRPWVSKCCSNYQSLDETNNRHKKATIGNSHDDKNPWTPKFDYSDDTEFNCETQSLNNNDKCMEQVETTSLNDDYEEDQAITWTANFDVDNYAPLSGVSSSSRSTSYNDKGSSESIHVANEFDDDDDDDDDDDIGEEDEAEEESDPEEEEEEEASTSDDTRSADGGGLLLRLSTLEKKKNPQPQPPEPSAIFLDFRLGMPASRCSILKRSSSSLS